jgi:hypothetical protein
MTAPTPFPEFPGPGRPALARLASPWVHIPIALAVGGFTWAGLRAGAGLPFNQCLGPVTSVVAGVLTVCLTATRWLRFERPRTEPA